MLLKYSPIYVYRGCRCWRSILRLNPRSSVQVSDVKDHVALRSLHFLACICLTSTPDRISTSFLRRIRPYFDIFALQKPKKTYKNGDRDRWNQRRHLFIFSEREGGGTFASYSTIIELYTLYLLNSGGFKASVVVGGGG